MSRRRSGRWIVAVGLVAAGWALAGVPEVRAEQDPNLARGFSAGAVHDFSGIDSINLFNGGLSVNLPIGPRYPVGDGLSYGLHLSYASNTWEPEAVWLPEIRMHPRRSANAGHGWMLSLAGTLYRRPPGLVSMFSSGLEWESPDGSEHLFYQTLHEGEGETFPCGSTRDNSYLTLCTAPSRFLPPPPPPAPPISEELERYTIGFPDGTIQTYEEIPVADRLSDWDDERFRVVRIEDPFGNWVTVDYLRVLFNLTWTIKDSVGRTHTAELSRDLVDGQYRWRVNRAKLRRFAGGTEDYDFVYERATIDRSCKTNKTIASPTEFEVSLLREVVLPAGAGSYRMPGYNSECTPLPPANPLGDLPGTLARLDLPTGGRLEWTYRDHVFIVPDPNDPVWLILERSTGVFEKKALNAAGGCDSGALSACTWTYGSSSFSDDTRRMRVVDPAGDRTVHWFRQRRRHPGDPLYVGWDYGLPFSTDHPYAGLFLSRQIYKGSASDPVVHREIYVSYERDRLITNQHAEEDWRNSNRRPVAERTRFYDDVEAGVPHFTEVRYDDFDGHGHYRRTTRSGDFQTAGVIESHTTTTTYNPARGTYAINPATNLPGPTHSFTPWPAGDPWVLGNFTSTRVEQPGTAVASQYCFESSTGRLTRERMQASASGPGSSDVIVVHNRVWKSATEIWRVELAYGGDGQAVSTGTNLCTLSLPSTPVYRTRHTHRYGVRAEVLPLLPNGSNWLGFTTLDLTIDQSTGLPSASTDAAGLKTNYFYDARGRLVAIRPVAGGDGWTAIAYETATETSPAQVTVTRKLNGGGGAVLEESRYVYDPFGRVRRDQRQIPGHGLTSVDTVYNALGWKLSVSERGPGSPPHKTVFKEHDPFGRPLRIELPDYPGDTRHWVKLRYNGARRITREVSIGSDLAGSETRSETVELYDHLGRLFRVQEPSGPGGGLRDSNYFYDAAGRLTLVRLKDNDGFQQQRSFGYDGRGFLLTETHPENGTTVYSGYDPRGHAGRKRTGPANGAFDLGFSYDTAARLTQVREWGSGRLLKEFSYGTGISGADRSNNKIKTAVRHNHVLHPDLGNQLDIIVTETYTYGGTGGRVSRRDTALNTGQGFTQGWTYDDLGQVTLLTYPTCTHSGATCSSGAGLRSRDVGFTHQLGYLTAVPGWAGTISYHANGMLNEVHHANGMIYQQGLDPHWMRRPAWLGVTFPNNVLEPVPGPFAVPLPYTYDGAGNVKSWADEEYRYDPVSRILEGRLGGGETQAYTYDVYGNIRTITTNRGSGPQTIALGVDRTTNRLSASLYDTAGNLLNRGGFTYGYDALSMMQTMAGAGNDLTHIYTADDERIWSVEASSFPWSETFTLRDLDGKVLRVFTTTSRFDDLAWSQDYIYREGQLLATARVAGAGETKHHFHLNHLGTPLLVTNPQGASEALHSYFPFGEELNPDLDTERMKLTGHERDLNRAGQGDDLDYMHARYCSPMLGRFLSVDPINSANPLNPQGWNRYSYVFNNPLNATDPSGRAVQLKNEADLALLKEGIPASLHRFIVLDGNQISREMINKAQTDNANFLALKDLANSEAVVEFFTAPSFVDSKGVSGDFYYSSVDSLIAEWAPKLGLDEARRLLEQPELFLGVFNTPEDSPSGIAQVVVADGSGRAAGAPRVERVVTAAHELYGHALLWAQGKPWDHDGGGAVDQAISEIERRTRGGGQ